jgi:predicted GIY-YIG superfamily endonuclease
MPFPNFKLYHGQSPHGCEHSSRELAARCEDALGKIITNLPKAFCLARCRSGSQRCREELLNQFSFPCHQEDGRKIARGLYIFFDSKEATRDNAFYVGIANDVPKRLINHLSAKSHEQSSLLYLLMKRHLPDDALVTWDAEKEKMRRKTRAELFKDNKGKCGEIRDLLLEQCSVVIHPVPDIMMLHVLEAMVAIEFKTGPWNSFKPH